MGCGWDEAEVGGERGCVVGYFSDTHRVKVGLEVAVQLADMRVNSRARSPHTKRLWMAFGRVGVGERV